MRLPLILAAKPVVGFRFPTVTLHEGEWFISSDHKNSSPVLNFNTTTVSIESKIKLDKPTQVHVTFSRGGDSHVSIFAERIV